MSDQEKKDETDLDKVLPDESYSLNEPVIEKIFGFYAFKYPYIAL